MRRARTPPGELVSGGGCSHSTAAATPAAWGAPPHGGPELPRVLTARLPSLQQGPPQLRAPLAA